VGAPGRPFASHCGPEHSRIDPLASIDTDRGGVKVMQKTSSGRVWALVLTEMLQSMFPDGERNSP